MPQGLQIWDEAGNLIMDTPTQIGRYLGLFDVGTATSGSMNIPGLDSGTPFAIPIMSTGTTSSTYSAVSLPRVTFSGSTLSWLRQAPASGVMPAASLLVGVY